MNNLKRILCLALSAVMLIGMMTFGSGAANFTDADEIINTEAVEITSGLGLFAGTADGKFDPKGTVTRAQMATIIVKMLRGSDFNADAFKGSDTFSDTASFEGGWAEGYINACAQMGVVKGYGDGTYRPGRELTTAEAVTMIINALKVDAGEGTWPLTVMAKAQQMKLFSELASSPDTNSPLSRDNLSSVVLQGLKYSPEGNSGYEVMINGTPRMFDNFSEAFSVAQKLGLTAADIRESVGSDSLAEKTFGMKVATGIVMDNQATGQDYTILNDNVRYDVKTDLNAYGHMVTIYYKDLSKETYKQVYCVIDDCTNVKVNTAISTSKNYKEAFGKSIKLTKNASTGADAVNLFNGTYVSTGVGTVAGYTAGSAAPAGTYVIKDDEVITYFAPAPVIASYVSDVNTYEGSEGILIAGANGGNYIPNRADDDKVVEYSGIIAGDFVTYIEVKGNFILSAVDPIHGTITNKNTVTVGGAPRNALTLNGAQFLEFNGTNNAKTKLTTSLSNIDFEKVYDLYVTQDDEFIGYKVSSASAGTTVSDVAFLLGAMKLTGSDEFGTKSVTYKARGIDMAGKEVMLLIAKLEDTNGNGAYDSGEKYWGDLSVITAAVTKDAVKEGFYYTKTSTVREEREMDLQVLTPVATSYDGQGGLISLIAARDINGYSASRGFATNDGLSTYHRTGAKYMKLASNAFDSTSEIRASVSTSISYSINTDDPCYVLASRAEGGNKNYVEVIINNKSFTENALLGGGSYYFTQHSIDESSHVAGGYSYTVYNFSNGKEGSLISNTPVTVPGFYSGTCDSDKVYTLTKYSNNSTSPSNAFLCTNYGITYVEDTHVGVTTAVTSRQPTRNEFVAGSKAVVVDGRSETEVTNSQVERITTLKQLGTLISSCPDVAVTADMYVTYSLNHNDSRVSAIYITGIYRQTPGFGTILYAFDAPSATGGTDSMVYVKTNAAAGAGAKVNVTYDSCDSGTYSGPGFYRFSSDVNGMRTLLKLSANTTALGLRGTIGEHNYISSLNATTGAVTTTDAHGTTTGVTCDTSCYDGSAKNEALKDFAITDEAMIFDATGKTMTLSDLATYYAANPTSTMLSYYCSGAPAAGADPYDDTPEIIFLCPTIAVLTPDYTLADEDVVYIPGTAVAGKLNDAYILHSATDPSVVDGVTRKILVPAGTSNSGSSTKGTGRFWTMDGTSLVRNVGVWEKTYGVSAQAYKIGYHDKISAISGTSVTLSNVSGHTGSGTACTYAFGDACGQPVGNSRQQEVNAKITVDSTTMIIDLRGDVVNGLTSAVTTVAQIKNLTDAGLAVVNTYAPAGTSSNGGVAAALIVVDHAPNMSNTYYYYVTTAPSTSGGTVTAYDLTNPAAGAISLSYTSADDTTPNMFYGLSGGVLTAQTATAATAVAGYHNFYESYSGTTLTLTDGATVTDHDTTTCGFTCTGNEVLTATAASTTPVVDLTDKTLTGGTLATLADLVTFSASHTVLIDHYSATPSVLFVTAAAVKPITPSAYVGHTLFIAGTTNTAGGSGLTGYDLDALDPTAAVSVDYQVADVAATNAFYTMSYDATNGNTLTLVTAGASANYHNFFANLSGGTMTLTDGGSETFHDTTACGIACTNASEVLSLAAAGTDPVVDLSGNSLTTLADVVAKATANSYTHVSLSYYIPSGGAPAVYFVNEVKEAASYTMAEGDVIFVPGKTNLNTIAECYIVNSVATPALNGTKQTVKFPASGVTGADGTTHNATSSNNSSSRFWGVNGGSLSRVVGVWEGSSGGHADRQYKFGYHDVIVSYTATTFNLKHAAGHTGAKSYCTYKFDGACGQSSGTPNNNRYSECARVQNYDASTIILDLRSAVVAGTETAVTTVAEIKDLCDAGTAIINTYVPNGVKVGSASTNTGTSSAGGTAAMIIVLDHTPA